MKCPFIVTASDKKRLVLRQNGFLQNLEVNVCTDLKKANLKKCEDYRQISLIRQAVKSVFCIILVEYLGYAKKRERKASY